MNSEQNHLIAQPPQPGDIVLGRYKLHSNIGNGGMGSVFLATDLSLANHKVALKFLNPHLASRASALTRLKNEVLVSRRLNHANLVRTYSFETTANGQHLIAMEYVHGTSLSALLISQPLSKLPWQEAIRIIRQIVAALDHAHKLKVVHRDLKPENILLTSEGIVKVVDFGLARVLDSDHTYTKAGEALGTPYYMAPEQFRGENVGPASDIYSLGIVTYELLTGTRPFSASSYFSLALQHLGDELPPITDTGIPDHIVDFVSKCSAKKIEDRWSSMEEISAALEAYKQPESNSRWTTISRAHLKHKFLTNFIRNIRKAGIGVSKFLLTFLALLSLYIALGSINLAQRARFAAPLIWADYHLPLQFFRPIRYVFGYGDIDTHDIEGYLTGLDNAEPVGDTWGKIQMLNRARIPVSWADKNGATPLHRSVEDSAEWSTTLVARGADCNAQDYNGENALMRAVKSGDRAIIESLLFCTDLSMSDYTGTTVLMLAVITEKLAVVKLLLAQHLPKTIINHRSNNDDTALSLTLHNGKVNRMQIISALMNAGADPLIRNRTGTIPLITAANLLQADAVEALLGKRSKEQIDVVDEYNQDALAYATTSLVINEADMRKTIQLLVDAGSNPNRPNSNGFSPLDLAKLKNNVIALKIFEEANNGVKRKLAVHTPN